MYQWMLDFKQFLLRNQKTVLTQVGTCLLGCIFLFHQDTSEQALFLLAALAFFTWGLKALRDYSFDPSLLLYNRQKTFLALFLLSSALLFVLVQIFFVSYASLVLALYLGGFFSFFLSQHKKRYFDWNDCLKSRLAKLYLLFLGLGLLLLLNQFLFFFKASACIGVYLLFLSVLSFLKLFYQEHLF